MMHEALAYPRQRKASFQQWSPSIHYAQFQTLQPCKLEERRLYDFELLFVRQGELVTHIHGKRYTIGTGQLIYLPSGVYHHNEVTSRGETHFIGIHFDYFDELDIQTEADIVVNERAPLEHKFGWEAYADIFPALSANIIYTPSPVCIELMEKLVHEFTDRPLGYELICKGLMLQILAHLLRSPLSRANAHISQHGALLIKLMDQIEAKPAEPWSNSLIADRLDLSIDYTAKLFKQYAGMPPAEFVQSVRHREARKLLRETSLPIERIGERVGYPDIHYFSRIFRRLEGISATEYRRLSQVF